MGQIDAQAGLARARTRGTNIPSTCLGFVFAAYGSVPSIGPGSGHYGIAYNAWVYSNGQHPGDTNPPVGVPVVFGPSPTRSDRNAGAGDIAISMGGGLLFCSDGAGSGRTGVMTIGARAKQTGRPYLGWMDDFLGHQLVNIGPVIGAPVPAGQARGGVLAVDGGLGRLTITRWQEVMGTPADGIISPVSTLVRVVQSKLNGFGYTPRLVLDGRGIAQNNSKTHTIDALQWHLGTVRDGRLSLPVSGAVKALQTRLNAGTF